MLLKIIDDDRVKILMEERDIEQYNLPFEKLNYDDPYSRAFIYELIQKTYDETGIDLNDCRVMIEVVPGVARAYYILLSKIKHGGQEQIEFDKAELPEMIEHIFLISTGERLICFMKRLKEYYPQESALYFYDRKYYVVLSFTAESANDKGFANFIDQLEEYGERCGYQMENQSILQERGTCLVAHDAVGMFVKDD